MFSQIASVLDSSRSYNDSPVHSPSVSGCVSPAAVPGGSALWMTPLTALHDRYLVDEFACSEPTLPTSNKCAIKQLFSSSATSSETPRALVPWSPGSQRLWFVVAEHIWNGSVFQRTLTASLFVAQAVTLLALALSVTEECWSPGSWLTLCGEDIVWWTVALSLTLVSLQLASWLTVSLPAFYETALLERHPTNNLLLQTIKVLLWELLNLLDTWLVVTGINYLILFDGPTRVPGGYLLSTSILCAGLIVLGLKYRGRCRASSSSSSSDPNNLYYNLDYVGSPLSAAKVANFYANTQPASAPSMSHKTCP